MLLVMSSRLRGSSREPHRCVTSRSGPAPSSTNSSKRRSVNARPLGARRAELPLSQFRSDDLDRSVLRRTPDDAVADAYRAIAIPVKPEEIRPRMSSSRPRPRRPLSRGNGYADPRQHECLLPGAADIGQASCASGASSTVRSARCSPATRSRSRDVRISVHGAADPGEPGAVTYDHLVGWHDPLFVSGDTAGCPAIAEVGASRPDYALLAFGRTWYMSEEEMLAAASDLSPGTLLPFHWEFWRNHTGDIAHLLDLYHRERPPFDLKILLIGDSLPLTPRAD